MRLLPGFFKATLINCLHKRSAALGDAQKLAYLHDMSHFLRFIRLASHLTRRINQRFLDIGTERN